MRKEERERKKSKARNQNDKTVGKIICFFTVRFVLYLKSAEPIKEPCN